MEYKGHYSELSNYLRILYRWLGVGFQTVIGRYMKGKDLKMKIKVDFYGLKKVLTCYLISIKRDNIMLGDRINTVMFFLKKKFILLFIVGLTVNISPASAQDDGGNGVDLPTLGESEQENGEEVLEGGYTKAQIAEMINNPLGELWLLAIQNDTYSYGGDILDKLDESNLIMNTTLLMPVLPMQLTENWKLIARPIIPINSFRTPEDVTVGFDEGVPEVDVDFQRQTGLGDIVLWTALATNEMAAPPNIWGFGSTMMFDTASDDNLGTGQNSIGPMAMALHVDDTWIYGLIGQHWWSVDEDKDRNDVSLTDIQYIGRYRINQDTNIGFSPNIRYNHEATSGNRWSIPVGLGIDTMIKLGPVPAKIGIEFYHYVEQADPFGPEWQVRLFLVPVIPAPSWTKKSLF